MEFQDLTVGAPNDDDGNEDSGAIYNLFLDRSGSVQGFQKISNTTGRLTQGNAGTPLGDGDIFGTAAGPIGDFNNDGLPDIAIGAPRDDDGNTNQGAVWLLSINPDGTAASATKISAADLPAGTLSVNDQFGGRHIANIGDLDGDGQDELSIGAYRDDDGAMDAGALYTLFFNEDLSVRGLQKISALEGGLDARLDTDDLFGMTVAPSGDLDGDGIADLIVGNNKDDDGGEDRGAVFFLLLNADGTVKAEAKVSSTDDFGFNQLSLLDNERFGRALGFVGDMSGDGSQVVAVGAGAGTDGGAIWLLKFDTVQSVLLGDCNLDGFINFADISPFISFLSAGTYLEQADINQDDIVDFSDISPFIGLLSSN